MNDKKLLTLTSTFPRWQKDPTPLFVHFLAKHLTGYFKIFVLAPHSKGSKVYEEVDAMQIRRFRYWFESNNNLADGAILPNLKKNKALYLQIPFFIVSEFLYLVNVCRKEKIDIIHAHWIIPQGLVAVLYKQILNKEVKIVITSHGADAFALQKLNFLKRWIINQVDSLTVVTHEIKSKLLELDINPKIPINVIPMGVDSHMFHPEQYDQELKKQYDINGPFLLFIGRLSDKKGIHYLIEAMPDIFKQHSQAKLLIIGYGEERSNVEEKIKKKQLSENILLLGGLSNQELPPFYATADVLIAPFIISSDGDREGMPVTLLEALACNCKIVTTEVVKDNLQNIPNASKLDQHIQFIKQKSSSAIVKGVSELIEKGRQRDAGESIIKELQLDWKQVASRYQKILAMTD